MWSLCGALVVLFIFFAALGGIDPAEAAVASIIIAVMGVLWLVHFWRLRSASDESRINREDRERRGF
jgi:hypothetical protein